MAVPSESEIRALLAKSYSPSAVPKLEEYLAAICAGQAPYMFDAVRTLVKLYQLFPSAGTNAAAADKNIGYACVLAMQQHGTDLLALQYLIPVAAQKDEPCATASRCAALLDACLFADFWALYNSALVEDSSDTIIQEMSKAAVPALQLSILAVLALSYKEAPVSVVMAALNVESAAGLKSSPGIESVSETTVSFTATPDNTKRQRVYQEGVNFPTIAALLQKIAQ